MQPGPGNPLPPRETYTLRDMDERSLRVLRHRRDIACVLVNPLQALHPNAGAPGDSSLVDSTRRAGFDRAAYTAWLEQLRAVCSERGIALIFDEVFVGFRFAPGGAQAYFGVRADMVTYGKTLGGGLPVRAANLSTIWTVLYTRPSRYDWMLQFYLRKHGLALSWVGTGRLIFSLNHGDAEFDEVARRFVEAARAMVTDGWWWDDPAGSNHAIRRGILREMLRQRF